MGVLHIIEHKDRELSHRNNLSYPLFVAAGSTGLDDDTLTTSTTTAAFTIADATRYITILPTVGVHIKIGTGTVEATTSNFYVSAYDRVTIELTDASTRKIAAIEPS